MKSWHQQQPLLSKMDAPFDLTVIPMNEQKIPRIYRLTNVVQRQINN